MSQSTNWGLIKSGEVFQSLVNTLVGHKDPKARLLTRPGRDGAQDCVSGDGTTVYQAKFHADRSPAKFLRDAQNEADTIAEYRSPEDPRYELWRNKKRWIGVTNARFNANDRAKWDSTIVPAFAKVGLVAECWTSGDLESFLVDYPEVYRAYFEGETRLFRSLSEERRKLVDAEVIEGGSADDFRTDFAGRDAEFSAFDQFIQGTHRVLLVHGPGGIGKSRFMYEAACRAMGAGAIAEAYWGNLENLEASTAWYAGLVPERGALLILDEPDEPALLRRVLEEMRGSLRVAKWKVVVVVRTPKSPVVAALRDSRNRLLAPELELAPLDDSASTRLAEALADAFMPDILKDRRADVIQTLRAVSAAFPMWMTIATELLRSGQDLSTLPHHSFELAEQYLQEIATRGLRPEEEKTTLTILRWLSLVQPMNSEDPRVVDFISTQSGVTSTSALELLVKLSSRRAVRRSGLRNRIFAVSPDVLRDHILLAWLSFRDSEAKPPRRFLSSDGEALVRALLAMIEGKVASTYLERLIGRVGYMEFILNREVDLLGPIASALVNLAKDNVGASSRRGLLGRASAIAFFRPSTFTAFVQFLRENPATQEVETNPLRDVTLTQADLILELAWPLFSAGASTAEASERGAVLNEMANLVIAEAALGVPLPNNGRRADSLLRRLTTNDAELASSYHAEAFELGQRMIKQLGDERALWPAELVLVRAALEPQLELERTQTWFDDEGLHMARVQLDTNGDLGKLRAQLREGLWAIVLSRAGHVRNRQCAWKLIAHSHRDANQGARRGEKALATEATENLERAAKAIFVSSISLAELHSAREVWDWNLRFDTDAERKALASECEGVLANHPDAIGLVELLAGDLGDRDAKRDQVTTQLSTSNATELKDFFDRCVHFVSGTSEQWRMGTVRHIAFEVGRKGAGNPTVKDYACASSKTEPQLTDVRLSMVSGLAEAMRPNGDAVSIVERALSSIDDASLRARLVFDLYGFSAPVLSLNLTLGELEMVAARLAALVATNSAAAFRVIGRFIGVDATRVFDLAKAVWSGVSLDARDACFTNFVDGLHDRLLFAKTHPAKFGTSEWTQLLDLMVGLPDIDLGGNLFWTLNDLRKGIDRLTPAWMVSFLEKRESALARSAEEQTKDYHTHIIPHQREIFEWVRDIDAQNPEDRAALERVLSWVGRDDEIGYAAPDLLSRLDPKGAVAPDVVATRLRAMSSVTPIDDVWRLARLGGYYVEGTPAWRTIAVPTTKLAREHASERDQASLYGALKWHRAKSWSGRHGEFHPRWEQAVEDARRKRDSESDENVRAYFDWRLRLAEAELERERGLFEERNE